MRRASSAALGIAKVPGRRVSSAPQSGQVFRLRNKGIKPVRSSVHGDLYCHVAIETPVKLTARQKELLHEFEAINAETQLLFASDWPHWDFDLPSSITTLPFLKQQAKRNILGLNAAKLFGLEVPKHKLAKARKSPAERVPVPA